MHAASPVRASLVPVFAAALALALLAAPFWPALFPVVIAASSVAACSLALARRPARPLVIAVAGLALWLVAGLAGAWLLRGHVIGGFAWVLAVLYVLPLPVIPWVYWRTFEERAE